MGQPAHQPLGTRGQIFILGVHANQEFWGHNTKLRLTPSAIEYCVPESHSESHFNL